MNIEAGGGAGGSNNRSCSSEKSSAETNETLDLYQDALEARALYAEAERVRMLIKYADMEQQIDHLSGIEIEEARLSLHEAKLRVMRSAISSTTDLAVKVLVAAEDGFRSADINDMLARDAMGVLEVAQ